MRLAHWYQSFLICLQILCILTSTKLYRSFAGTDQFKDTFLVMLRCITRLLHINVKSKFHSLLKYYSNELVKPLCTVLYCMPDHWTLNCLVSAVSLHNICANIDTVSTMEYNCKTWRINEFIETDDRSVLSFILSMSKVV